MQINLWTLVSHLLKKGNRSSTCLPELVWDWGKRKQGVEAPHPSWSGVKGSLVPPRSDLRPWLVPCFRGKVCPSLIYLLLLLQGLTGAKGEPGPMGIPGVKVSGLLGAWLGQS